MHDAVRTRYGTTMCRRPPDGADLPPHYKHGRLSRPQPFAGAATVARATDLDTKNVKVFSDGPNWESGSTVLQSSEAVRSQKIEVRAQWKIRQAAQSA
jgi:hypothetical protein